VKQSIFVQIAASFLIGTVLASADSAATVTQVYNQVDHGKTQSTDTTPAKVGTVLGDGEYVKTGAQSRAELKLANSSITRLGANTIFNYSASSNQLDLQSGTMLFSKPKDGKPMTVKTAAVTAAIVGTTGFIQKQGNSFMFGLIEGTATLTIGGVDYTITAGQILKFTPGSPPQILAFNVPLLLATSPLITKFPHDLPNEGAIKDEVADYNDLVSRGFIQPPQQPYFIAEVTGYVPTVPIPGTDSAGQALNLHNTPPPQDDRRPPPPPPPPPPCCWQQSG